jgi:hypothetical protein
VVSADYFDAADDRGALVVHLDTPATFSSAPAGCRVTAETNAGGGQVLVEHGAAAHRWVPAALPGRRRYGEPVFSRFGRVQKTRKGRAPDRWYVDRADEHGLLGIATKARAATGSDAA